MKRLLKTSIYRKLLILMILSVGTIFLAVADDSASVHAYGCCSECAEAEQQCQDYYAEWGYSSVYACMQGTGVTRCYRYCDFSC